MPVRPVLLTVLVALAAALSACGGGQEPPGAPGTELLPDLDVVAPGRLAGRNGGTDAEPRFFLGFESAAENVGRGPLLVEGRRPRWTVPRMTVRQTVLREAGPPTTRAVESVMEYVTSADHAHWHLLDFMRYELRRPDGTPVAPDRKTGFCLGDRYGTTHDLPDRPAKAVYTDECRKGRPGALEVDEGISVGYGDDYDPLLEGQELELTGLPGGRYLIVHRVNPERTLRESDYANNESSLLIAIEWPSGPKEPPSIEVLAECPDSAACTG